MAAIAGLSSMLRRLQVQCPRGGRRFLTSIYSPRPEPVPMPAEIPQQFLTQLPERFRPDRARQSLKIYPPPPSARKDCKNPVAAVNEAQMRELDPSGERRALFDYRRNPRSVKPGDILRVTFRNGDPFSGVCLSIRLRGIDTTFLLRNHLTRVPVEMWIKALSPNVQSVEVVQRAEGRKRRARLYYMRNPKHDMGSVENIVANYVRQKSALAGQAAGGRKRRP